MKTEELKTSAKADAKVVNAPTSKEKEVLNKAGEPVQDIILGYGKFSIDDIDVLLTRGGGQWTINREYRNIEADGMKSIGEGMTVIDREEPKLTMNMLSIFQGVDFTKLYPAMKSEVVTASEGKSAGTKITSSENLLIASSDYHTIKWTGVTAENRGVVITIEKAINLENIDWTLVDKDEIIQALTYTGVAPKGEKFAKWDVTFLTA